LAALARSLTWLFALRTENGKERSMAPMSYASSSRYPFRKSFQLHHDRRSPDLARRWIAVVQLSVSALYH
jgi:hypothetical protein